MSSYQSKTDKNYIHNCCFSAIAYFPVACVVAVTTVMNYTL
ncbi:hypothetical protein [Lachnospira multipara]|nr:hypothetical protein [Lachnospira multipara]